MTTATVNETDAGRAAGRLRRARCSASRARARRSSSSAAPCASTAGRRRRTGRAGTGDVVEADPPAPEPIEAQPQDIPLDVVYEDGELLVVNKPQGMVVHPAPGNPDGTLVNALLAHCGDGLVVHQRQNPPWHRPPHR